MENLTHTAAIIGCGPHNVTRGGINSISYAHAAALRKLPDFHLAAAASRNPQNAADFASEFPGVTPYIDYREMLRRERPSFVSICAFPGEREEMAMAALEHGAKVLWIEKPFAVSMGAARRILDTAAQAGARVFVNHQRRYARVLGEFRDAVQRGAAGELISFDVVQPGHCLMNFGPHLVDAALFAMGSRTPVRILAAADFHTGSSHQAVPAEDHLAGFVHFDDGTRLSVAAGRNGASRLPLLRAHCTEGFAELHLSPLPGTSGVVRLVAAGKTILTPEFDEHFHHGNEDKNLFCDRAAADIIRCASTGQPSRIDGSEAIRSLEILLGLFESARTRRMIELPMKQEDSPFDLPQQ